MSQHMSQGRPLTPVPFLCIPCILFCRKNSQPTWCMLSVICIVHTRSLWFPVLRPGVMQRSQALCNWTSSFSAEVRATPRNDALLLSGLFMILGVALARDVHYTAEGHFAEEVQKGLSNFYLVTGSIPGQEKATNHKILRHPSVLTQRGCASDK